MKFISRRRVRKTGVTIFIIIGIAIFYNEIYLYNSNNWKQLDCPEWEKCKSILLVADPQLIGERNEKLHFLSFLTIWDSDRYLRKTYSSALKFTNADIVIFLGDLFDEGSIANYIEFNSYVKRLKSIFNISNRTKILYIFLPGDNDIGGEGGERISFDSLYRFESAFNQQQILEHENLKFIKVNRLTRSIPRHDEKIFNEGVLKIVLSHMPLLFMPSQFVDKVLDNFQPDLILTAHEHKSMIVTTDIVLKKDRQIIPITKDSTSQQFDLKLDNYYEIIVPTCSYRMGTDKIGFGYLILDSDEFRYTVLWSPSRFSQLIGYLIIFILMFIGYLFNSCYRCIRSRRYSEYVATQSYM